MQFVYVQQSIYIREVSSKGAGSVFVVIWILFAVIIGGARCYLLWQ